MKNLSVTLQSQEVTVTLESRIADRLSSVKGELAVNEVMQEKCIDAVFGRKIQIYV
jgi:hypothetical protein